MITLPIRTDWRRRLLAIGGILLLFIVVGAYVSSRAEAKSSVSKSGMHVLTIYDGGEEKGLLTDADTLREALEQAEIKISETDVTEPNLDEQLVSATYEVNIYRSRPVVIYDDTKRTKIMTPYSTAKQIAKQAGIELQDEDEAVMEHTTDILSDGAFEKLTVNRAVAFNLVLYGKKIPSFTMANTVEEMLADKKIALESSDSLSVAMNAAIKPGMTVEIWRDGKQTVTEEETVKKPVQKINDADREIGYREVKTPGKDGKRNVTYEIIMKNGKEVSREEISSVVTEKPVKEVVVIGTKPATMAYSGGGSKSDWLAASVIPQSDWGYADWLVQKESGWNPNAVNAVSGACGLGQQLPCGKWDGQWNNPVDSLNGMNGYVIGRYGGWAQAVAHSKANGWY